MDNRDVVVVVVSDNDDPNEQIKLYSSDGEWFLVKTGTAVTALKLYQKRNGYFVQAVMLNGKVFWVDKNRLRTLE